MHPKSVTWVTGSVGILFAALGLWALVIDAYREGAIWLALGLLLVLFGTANQREPLAPWRIVTAIVLALAAVVLLILQVTTLH